MEAPYDSGKLPFRLVCSCPISFLQFRSRLSEVNAQKRGTSETVLLRILQALARARQSALHAGRVWRKEWNHPKTQVRPSTTNVGRARASQMKGRQENETALLQNSIEPTRAALFPDLGLIVHSNGWG